MRYGVVERAAADIRGDLDLALIRMNDDHESIYCNDPTRALQVNELVSVDECWTATKLVAVDGYDPPLVSSPDLAAEPRVFGFFDRVRELAVLRKRLYSGFEVEPYMVRSKVSDDVLTLTLPADPIELVRPTADEVRAMVDRVVAAIATAKGIPLDYLLGRAPTTHVQTTTGAARVAKCGHPGEVVIGNYVQCAQGCDRTAPYAGCSHRNQMAFRGTTSCVNCGKVLIRGE